MTTPRAERDGTLADLISGLLDRGYNRTVEPVLRAIALSTGNERGIVARRLAELEAEAMRLAEAGEPMRADNPVLRALVADLDDVLAGHRTLLDGAANDLLTGAADSAAVFQRQAALGGRTDAQLQALGIEWRRVDPEAVGRLVDLTERDAWDDALAGYGEQVSGVVRNQAIRGMVEGWGPLRTAREIRRVVNDFPAHVANTFMRTTQLTAYRAATAANQNVNRGVIVEVVRISALDERVCLSCIAQHGDVIWRGATQRNEAVPRVLDHHNGRCTSIARVVGVPFRVPEGGETWFNGLPRERRLAIAGAGALEVIESGRVGLRDFIHPYEDPLFGDMVRQASITQAVQNAESR